MTLTSNKRPSYVWSKNQGRRSMGSEATVKSNARTDTIDFITFSLNAVRKHIVALATFIAEKVKHRSNVRPSVHPSFCPVGHKLKVTHQGRHRRGQRTSRHLGPKTNILHWFAAQMISSRRPISFLPVSIQSVLKGIGRRRISDNLEPFMKEIQKKFGGAENGRPKVGRPGNDRPNCTKNGRYEIGRTENGRPNINRKPRHTYCRYLIASPNCETV